MDIFRPYSRPNPFRGVLIRPYLSPDIQHRYRICIWIFKSHIYDVDIQSYPIRYGWHYPYSNPNPDRNMKTNIISVISVRIRSVFIPMHTRGDRFHSIFFSRNTRTCLRPNKIRGMRKYNIGVHVNVQMTFFYFEFYFFIRRSIQTVQFDRFLRWPTYLSPSSCPYFLEFIQDKCWFSLNGRRHTY